MFRLKFQSDWTQAERSIHMARSSRANNSEFSSWFVQTRKSGPIDLFSTYFKYLVSQFKAFSCRSGVHFYTSMIKRNNGFMWPGALTFRTAPHRFLSVEDWMFCSETVPPCGRGGKISWLLISKDKIMMWLEVTFPVIVLFDQIC